MFGNVGLTDRLTFSAFGAAVNEVQRLQELTKKYPQSRSSPARPSPAIPAAAGPTLGQEKLRGVREKVTVLSPDMADLALGEEEGFEAAYDRMMSDAEQVMLLHRDAGQRQLPDDAAKKLQ